MILCNFLIVRLRLLQSFSPFLIMDISDHRWPTCSGFFMSIDPSSRESATPFRYILPIHNVPINRDNFFVNFLWTLLFCMKKTYEGMNFTFSGIFNCRCQSKHLLHEAWLHRSNEWLKGKRPKRFKIPICFGNTVIKAFFVYRFRCIFAFRKEFSTPLFVWD